MQSIPAAIAVLSVFGTVSFFCGRRCSKGGFHKKIQTEDFGRLEFHALVTVACEKCEKLLDEYHSFG